MYKLSFYVPESHLEQVKWAVMTAGAGRMGAYEQCAWQTLGTGQFLPTADSDPYQGKAGSLERIAEYQVEMMVDDALIKSVCEALLAAHPYEVPAYAFWKVTILEDLN